MSLEQNKCFELPLMVNPDKINRRTPQKGTDMPRQLKNDIYRASSKQNIPKGSQKKPKDQIGNPQQKLIQRQNNKILQASSKKEVDHLRQIIKRKLLINESNKLMIVSEVNPPKKQEIVQNKNRYHQLLREFYGGPRITPIINREKVSSQRKQTHLTRHQSAKSIKGQHSTPQQQPNLHKIRSVSSLKSSNQTSSKSILVPPKSPTYLDLYMQKRRPVLFL